MVEIIAKTKKKCKAICKEAHCRCNKSISEKKIIEFLKTPMQLTFREVDKNPESFHIEV
jgi:hypothetical protein